MSKIKKDYLYIILGTTLFSLGTTWFADPSGLVTGGVTGIAIVIKYLSGGFVPLFVTNIFLNIPLFIIMIKQRGFLFIKKSLFCFIWLTFMLFISNNIKNPLDVKSDIFISSLLTGTFTGIGLGLILKASATSGGTDMLAAIIKYKKAHFPISNLILIIDSLIIILGMFIFGALVGVYAIFSLFISTKIIGAILEGMHFAKAAYILSEKTDIISAEIFKILKRGNTSLYAKGMYTNKEKLMLYVVVDPKEIITLQDIVKNCDPNAFMTITDVRRVLGEGFINFKDMDNLF